MNVERLTELRNTILKLEPGRFNMNFWAVTVPTETRHSQHIYDADKIKHDCGTCACIGGWAEVLFSEDGEINEGTEYAGELLGLDYETASALFYPPSYTAAWEATPEQAAAVIDHLIITGEVDWSIIE